MFPVHFMTDYLFVILVRRTGDYMTMWPGFEQPIKKDDVKETSPEKLSVDAHARSDVDASDVSQHHTLGISHNQASPGDHIHDGKSSRQINIDASDVNGLTTYILNAINTNASTVAASVVSHLLSNVFTGSRNSDGWRQQVMNAFEDLGATDSTTS